MGSGQTERKQVPVHFALNLHFVCIGVEAIDIL